MVRQLGTLFAATHSECLVSCRKRQVPTTEAQEISFLTMRYVGMSLCSKLHSDCRTCDRNRRSICGHVRVPSHAYAAVFEDTPRIKASNLGSTVSGSLVNGKAFPLPGHGGCATAVGDLQQKNWGRPPARLRGVFRRAQRDRTCLRHRRWPRTNRFYAVLCMTSTEPKLMRKLMTETGMGGFVGDKANPPARSHRQAWLHFPSGQDGTVFLQGCMGSRRPNEQPRARADCAPLGRRASWRRHRTDCVRAASSCLLPGAGTGTSGCAGQA